MINSTVLKRLGALVDIALVRKGVVYIHKRWKAKREATGTSKDFIYELVKSHGRWIKTDKEYIKYHEVKIRANVSGLSEMQIGVGPTSKASFEVESLTPSVKLDRIQTPQNDLISEDYRIIFPTPLSKGETLQYKIKIQNQDTCGCQ